jgi:hypothetical protein
MPKDQDEMKMDLRDYYYSTPGQLEDLIRSAAWKDIVRELDIWQAQMSAGIEDFDLDVGQRVQDKMRGILQACRNFQNMPEILLENMLLDAKHDRREREENEKTKK